MELELWASMGLLVRWCSFVERSLARACISLLARRAEEVDLPCSSPSPTCFSRPLRTPTRPLIDSCSVLPGSSHP